MKLVPDTSAVIDGRITGMLKTGEYKDTTIIIPEAVVAELEAQANQGREIGFLGLAELQELSRMAREGTVTIQFVGERPTLDQVKLASGGEIDAIFRRHRRHGLWKGQWATSPVDLQFAQNITISKGRGQQDAHIARCERSREGHIIHEGGVFWQSLNILPFNGIIRNLQDSLSGALDPVQHDAIKVADSAEVHIDPFLRRTCALPGAGEMVGTAQFERLFIG